MSNKYKIQGTPNSPVLLFSNSLGCTLDMWDELVPSLLPYFRILQYDTRGHGGSSGTEDASGFKIGQLGADVIQLLDSLGIDKVYFCGLSMGGLIGQWLAIHYPQRIHKLVLSNTAAKIGTEERWNERIFMVNAEGFDNLAAGTMDRWFTPGFREAHPALINQWHRKFLSNHSAGYSSCCAAIRDADFRAQLHRISAPTLVITGSEDEVTTVADAEWMASKMPHARAIMLPCRHLSPVELPEQFIAHLLDFLIGISVTDRGMHIRRTVLGNAHVDRSLANMTSFNAEFQQLITQYAWGTIWSRPGLNKRERSLATLSMLIGLNKPNEFKMHVRAAIHNGLTIEEIKEIILHSAIYCGVPAANEAFHLAGEILKEMEPPDG